MTVTKMQLADREPTFHTHSDPDDFCIKIWNGYGNDFKFLIAGEFDFPMAGEGIYKPNCGPQDIIDDIISLYKLELSKLAIAERNQNGQSYH